MTEIERGITPRELLIQILMSTALVAVLICGVAVISGFPMPQMSQMPFNTAANRASRAGKLCPDEEGAIRQAIASEPDFRRGAAYDHYAMIFRGYYSNREVQPCYYQRLGLK